MPTPPSKASCPNSLHYFLQFEPGTRWDYGVGIDWLGRVVEKIDGRRIDRFCREEIFAPLDMPDRHFEVEPHLAARLASVSIRGEDGRFADFELAPPANPEFYGMGHALYSTAPDFMRFLRMVLNRGALDGRISPVSRGMRMAGPAFTVEVRAGDNLMIHAAIAMARPGDVLVIDGKGDTSCALMGSIMLNACKKIGLAGVVIDAAVRDTEELRELGFPVYAVGANPNGPTKFIPGRINWPISCGGVAISPGDLIVGDADGVVAIEREKAALLLDLAEIKVTDEKKRISDIQSGRNIRPKWLEASLRAAGVLGADESL